MPGFFEALENAPRPKQVIPKVTIQGNVFEVSVELFKEIQKHGIQEYHVEKGKIVMKPQAQAKGRYPTLEKIDKGYVLLDGNMFWPTHETEGGYGWTR